VTAFHVTLFAVVAAASPLALTATFVVIRSERPRINSIAFLTGYVLGTTIACVLGLIVGAAFVSRLDSHGTVESLVTLLLGATLLVVGARARASVGRAEAPPESSPRGNAILAGLREMGPAAACSMAALLGFGGPRRLLFTLLAMAAISGADSGRIADTTLVVSYIVIATALVAAPVVLVIVAAERAIPILGRGESWVKARAGELREWLSLGFGALLVLDALLRLFA
jgi:hypothetical protein